VSSHRARAVPSNAMTAKQPLGERSQHRANTRAESQA
jgi:hypothetical protein